MALVGNCIASATGELSANVITGLSFGRILLVPIVLFLNYQDPGKEHRYNDSLMKSGWVFWAVVIVLGFTHGLASSLSTVVASQKLSKAGMTTCFTMILAIGMGLAFSQLLAAIVLM